MFCTVPTSAVSQLNIAPIARFVEDEGVSLILLKSEAEANGLTYNFPSRMITLTVHSSLDAVGFLAAITQKLAARGIGVNPVSAYFHDHLFVPSARVQEAMEVLESFSKDAAFEL